MIMRAVLWLMIMLAAMIFSLSQVRISSDMAVFLPHTEEAAQASLLTVLREGPASRLVIVALSGLDDSRHLAEASRAMADRLRDNELFTRISNGPGSLSSKEQDYWFTYRYLLTELDVDDFTYQHLQADMHKRLEELTAPMPPLDKARMPADPQAVFRQVLAAWQNDNSPTLHHGVWFDHAKRHALLLLETQAGGLELDAQDEVRQAIMAAADSGLKLQMTGVGMLAAASREIIRSEAQWLSGLATLIIFLVLYLAYRKLRLLLLGGLPLLAALAIATSVTALLFGSVHGITLAFGLSLLGVAVDYPIHLFSHLQQNSSPQQTLQRIWPTIRLGAASTAVGYLAIATSPFQGLAQLAVFMVSGLLASVLTVRWLLPPLLASGQSLTHSYAARGAGRSVWFLLLPVVLALAYLAWTPRPLLQTELSALSPISADAREQDAYLRSLIGVPDVSRLLLIKADTVEEVLQASEALSPLLVQLRSKGIISGYRLPSTYLPSVARQLKRQAALPDKSTLSENLALASQDLPFRAGLFTPFLDAVAASKMLAPLTPEAVKDTLAGQMLDSVLHSTGGQWLGLVPLHDVQNEAILAAWTEQTGLAVQYINLRTMTDAMVHDFMQDVGGYLLLGFLLILLFLWLGLRDVALLARLVLPVLTALLLTIALLQAFGSGLSLFHVVALLLVLGLGIDYGLFFSRRSTDEAYARAGHGVTVCAISTASVFALLAWSKIPVLQAIGSTVALGVTLSYLLARFVRRNVSNEI